MCFSANCFVSQRVYPVPHTATTPFFYTLIVELDSLSVPLSLLFEKAGHVVVLGQGNSTGCSGDEHEEGGWDWQPREHAQKSL